jgi:urease accessory protein
MKLMLPIVAFLAVLASPAFAHIGHGSTSSFAAGLSHPFGGLDHLAVMIMVGLWAGLRGGRSLWAWPLAFVGVMMIGDAMGMTHVPLPFVELGIAASVIALGLLISLAVDVAVIGGVAMIAAFALFHGYAHGNEVTETTSGFEYMAGFALATAALHFVGIGFALTMVRFDLRPIIRIAGALCVPLGVGLLLL